MSQQQVACLAALADGIIPPDGRDGGAGAVSAGQRLGEKVNAGINSELYWQGLELAMAIAEEKYGQEVRQLKPPDLHPLIGDIRERLPGFFKQLRMDVSALYLSDPGVWRRIGFPGPSIASGGYPDFDQPQQK